MPRGTSSGPGSATLALAVVVILIAAGGYAAHSAYQSSGGQAFHVENESHTVTFEEPVAVDEDGYRYGTSESVYVHVDTTGDGTADTWRQAREGVDYQWDASSGNVTFLNSSTVEDGQSSRVTYTYYQETEVVQTIRSVQESVQGFVLPVLVLVVRGAGVIGFAKILPSTGGGRR